MNARDLKKFKAILLTMRTEALSQVSQIQKESLHHNYKEDSGDLSGYSTHMADMASGETELAMNLRMLLREENVLDELDEALKRLDNGTYGVCEACSEPIGKPRLTAKPFARLCIDCRQRRESGR